MMHILRCFHRVHFKTIEPIFNFPLALCQNSDVSMWPLKNELLDHISICLPLGAVVRLQTLQTQKLFIDLMLNYAFYRTHAAP